MLYKWLKPLRVAIGLVFLLVTSFVFVDIYELATISQIKKVIYLQFVPSLLSFVQIASWATAGFLFVVLMTLLIGRFYCSSICPLGIIQDIITYVGRMFYNKKMFRKRRKPLNWLRYSVLCLAIIVTLLGFSTVLTFIDPYSIAGRFMTYLFRPSVIYANNELVARFAADGSDTYYRMDAMMPDLFMLSATLFFLVVIGLMAFFRGRLYCNTICPVGTLLGLVSKVSLFKIKIDQSKCSKCAKCMSVCKSECIDLKTQSVDHSRCVTCLNCLKICPDKAIDFKTLRLTKGNDTNVTTNKGRRDAIATIGLLAISSKLMAMANTEKSKTGHVLKFNEKKHAVSPPGSQSIVRFNSICTGCGLCVSACPNKVLRPAMKEYGWVGFMQPHLDFSVSQCSINCTTCGNVCPTGAIKPVTHEEKATLQMGKAIFVKENCIVFTDETNCGACSEHCPTKAVDMVPYKGNLVIPQVNPDICIGCGACEHPCPLPDDYKAIYIEGNAVHLKAQKPVEEKATQSVQEDFPF
jgi:ferredoxin